MIRSLVKWSAVAGATLLVAAVVVGPRRVHDLIGTVHSHLTREADGMIAPQVKLEHELRAMEREYPRQLAELRSQLLEVEAALAEVSDEAALAEQVQAIAERDLAALEPEIAQVSVAPSTAAARALLAHAAQITSTRDLYAQRLEMAISQRALLTQERTRIAGELASLELEAAEFQAKISLLEREIEAVARNEQLIRVIEDRRAASERRTTRVASTSLTRLQQDLAARRLEQGERLDRLQATGSAQDYETRARVVLSAGQAPNVPLLPVPAQPATPVVRSF